MEQEKQFDIYVEIGDRKTDALIAYVEKSVSRETANKIINLLRNEK